VIIYNEQSSYKGEFKKPSLPKGAKALGHRATLVIFEGRVLLETEE
jgi:hypothetical protein